jgi:hypothetical protein
MAALLSLVDAKAMASRRGISVAELFGPEPLPAAQT